MRAVRFALLGCLAAAVVGCGGVKDANKGNFAKAVQAYLDSQNGVCAAIPAKEYPFSLANKGWFPDMKQRADALVDVGLLTRTDTQVKASFGKAMEEGSEYQLTELGKKFLVAGGANTMGGHDAFCSGKYEIVEIENFTEPSDAAGTMISRVNYSYKVKDVADWVKSEDLSAAYESLKDQVEGEVRDKAVLVLTNEGWLHERLFRR
ncbi:hypothetical protein AAFN46_12355 [Pseudomonas sp. CAU 1711]|uniref:hypothetical protein n=1 Tax=Pseudomonas sp. CAU 1711 TaxID=3140356 RepID=UPI003260D5EB